MPLYDVAVSRIFVVRIETQSEEEAAGLVPFYLGYNDSSEDSDRKNRDFEFKNIKMVENELISVLEAGDWFDDKLLPAAR